MSVYAAPSSEADPRYARPRAGVDPDRNVWWLGRIKPIVMVQKWSFLGSIGAGMVGTACAANLAAQGRGAVALVGPAAQPSSAPPCASHALPRCAECAALAAAAAAAERRSGQGTFSAFLQGTRVICIHQ